MPLFSPQFCYYHTNILLEIFLQLSVIILILKNYVFLQYFKIIF